MKIKAVRYHDISMGHRVVGHEGKCRFLHGHNYRIHFHCEAMKLDKIGRVIDFSSIKYKLCLWLEHRWDHKFLVFASDKLMLRLKYLDKTGRESDDFDESIVVVNFNPTAENIAKHLVTIVGPKQLKGTGVKLTKVIVDETRKCSASYEL